MTILPPPPRPPPTLIARPRSPTPYPTKRAKKSTAAPSVAMRVSPDRSPLTDLVTDTLAKGSLLPAKMDPVPTMTVPGGASNLKPIRLKSPGKLSGLMAKAFEAPESDEEDVEEANSRFR